MMVQFLVKKCRVCGKERKFQQGTDRDLQNICGECWVWDIERKDRI
jgi:hypothetical protein